MSVEQAQALVERAIRDPEFAKRLAETPIDQRRPILVEEGYGDVQLRHLSKVLPEAAGGELSDEEFAEVAGGLTDKQVLGSAAAFAGGATGTGIVVSVGLVCLA